MNVLPTARRAAQLDLAAEQARELAADGEAEAGAAVLAAGAGVGLLERLEDDLLLLGRDADAGVGDLERDDRAAPGAGSGGPRSSPLATAATLQPHAALLGELEGVREQVLEHLLQALRVGDDAAAEVGIDAATSNASRRLSASWRNGRATDVEQVGEEDLLGLDRHRARLDLREVEDVADEVQQVGAGAVDGARELDLLAGEVAVGVVAELLAEDQDAVERRAQLVRHVGQELGLVLRGERQLGAFSSSARRACSISWFLRSTSTFCSASCCAFCAELLVGLLQLLLLRLQLGGELLRLLQQALGLHRRLDAVEHDADAGGELLEERRGARR